MAETVPNLLQTISTTSGFAVFCILIATAYAGIWYIFFYEPTLKRRKTRKGEKEEQAEEKSKSEDKKQKPAQKQPA